MVIEALLSLGTKLLKLQSVDVTLVVWFRSVARRETRITDLHADVGFRGLLQDGAAGQKPQLPWFTQLR